MQKSWGTAGKDRIRRGERLPYKDVPHGICCDLLDRTERSDGGRQVDLDGWELTGELRQLEE